MKFVAGLMILMAVVAGSACRAGEYAWQQTDPCVAPNFEAFFPDDPEGGKVLDALLDSKDKDSRSDEEILAAIRNGLRRTHWMRSQYTSWIGGRFIEGKTNPDPLAIEILYHAADVGGEQAVDPYKTCWGAVWYGLSLVEPKTPAILRAMAAVCVHHGDADLLPQVKRNTQSQQMELIECLQPYLDSQDKAIQVQAEACRKIFLGELSAWKWQNQRDTEKAERDYRGRLPEIKEVLLTGDSEARRKTMELIRKDRIELIMDDSFIGAFAACAEDYDPDVREDVAVVVGDHWVRWATPQNADAIELMLRLSKDVSPQVRHTAWYYGLTMVRKTSDAVDRRIVEMIFEDRDCDSFDRILWKSKSQKRRSRLVAHLQPYLESTDPAIQAKAEACRKIFLGELDADEWFKHREAHVIPACTYEGAFRDLCDALGGNYPYFGLKRIDWPKTVEEFLPRAKQVATDEEFGLLCMELVARLEDSHACLLDGSATVPVVPIPRWDPGFACLLGEREEPIVYFVDKDGPAERAGVRAGMVVLSVNGVPADEVLEEIMRQTAKHVGYSSPRYLRYHAAQWLGRQMEEGAPVALEVRTPDGRTNAPAMSAACGVRYLPRLPVPIPGISDDGDVSWTRLEGGVGYIYVRRIGEALIPRLDQAVGELQDAHGLIVDVRGNSGGGFDAARATRNFSPTDGEEPERPRFRGPMALLIDARCISAGEGWASWFVAQKRARVFGEATAGASSRKLTHALANGLFNVRYSAKAYTGSLDRWIERRGLEPDVPLRQKAEDLAQGRDTVLEAARQYLLAAHRTGSGAVSGSDSVPLGKTKDERECHEKSSGSI